MHAPLHGIRVLEVASWLAAPSCAALMADMGAEVIKVEPPGGDAYRRMYYQLLGEGRTHPNYQFDNRGKRGICVNLDTTEGSDLVRRLATDVDIFVTNLTQERLERYALTETNIRAVSDKAVYAVLSGYGTEGPDQDRQAFDQTAFWARSGAMSMFGDRNDGPLLSRGGYGDRTTALNLLSAILAALRLVDKTNQGQYVEVTLQRTGIWALASDVNVALFDRLQPEKSSRVAPPNPIWNFYLTQDNRWLALVMPMALPYWARFCEMLNRPDWAKDERFKTLLGLAEHGPTIVAEVAEVFATQDLAQWHDQLDKAGFIWAPVATLPEVVEDPALRERDAFDIVVHEKEGAMEIVSTPFHIRGADVKVRGPAPDPGQHTREVLAELGLSESAIDQLFSSEIIS